MDSKKIVSGLLADAGVTVNGTLPWDIQVYDERFYQRVLKDADLGLGESYMDGWWDCESIDELINKILKARLDKKIKGDWKTAFYFFKAKLLNRQTKSRAVEVGERHYDLGNDLYQAMLDPGLNYSCAYWKNAKDLNVAQMAKLDLVCKKIDLKPGMEVMDLGCGWGGFAKYAAEKYGARVVAVNISKEQISLCRERCAGLPVEIRQQDYREMKGKFDAVVSIGFFEHVGYKNYRNYMQVTDRCLKDDGIAFIQTIGSNISRTSIGRFTDTYIFPNGVIPSIRQISRTMEGLFVMEDWHNFGPDYDKTLMAWYHNFNDAWPRLKEKYGDRFYRMWKYYLLANAGGFRSRSQQLWHIVLTKEGREQPDCRIC